MALSKVTHKIVIDDGAHCEYNCNDTNITKCCEVIEQNANVQRQLFGALSEIAAEAGACGNARSLIRSRLWPYFNDPYYCSSAAAAAALAASATLNADLAIYSTLSRKNAEIQDLTCKYESDIHDLENELNCTKLDNQDLNQQLCETKDEAAEKRRLACQYQCEVSDLKNKLNETKEEAAEKRRLATQFQCELADLKSKLHSTELKLSMLEPKASLCHEYERQINTLKEDIRVLRSTNDVLAEHNSFQNAMICSRASSPCPAAAVRCLTPVNTHVTTVRCRSPATSSSTHVTTSYTTTAPASISCHRPKSCSPSRCSRPTTPVRVRCQSPGSPLLAATQAARQDTLVSRYQQLQNRDRYDALNVLKTYCCDYENCQRIVFAAVQEAFSVAKRSFSDWKLRVRSTVALTRTGCETLEEGVQSYINRNIDLYDLPNMVSDVILGLNRNPRICLPIGVSYTVISAFIREACRVAWEMSCLPSALDVAFALDAEVVDENKYRRSYDSEYSAPLVNHHIWPCLMQGPNIISKGEACTRRGASLVTICRSRSTSPLRSILRSRSRSTSVRSTSRVRTCSPF
jgi:hypothetical protein